MGYELPAQVPAWRVEIEALCVSNPILVARVGWIKSAAHPVKTFRSKAAAESHIESVKARSRFSLIPIQYRGTVTQTVREPDWRDKLGAMFAAFYEGR